MRNPGPPTEALSELVLPESLPEQAATPARGAEQRTLLTSAPTLEPCAVAPNLPDYEILQALGRGGMGVVYKARQTQLNRLVALKMLLGGHLASQEARLRFLIEAEIVARVRHPNIVQIYEVGTYQEQPFLALEFIDGGCLADQLTGQPQPPRAAARLLETLARAIHAAHLQGIVHRDLKPANILLTWSRAPEDPTPVSDSPARASGARLHETIPKITDFGLAKLQGAADLTQPGTILGTPHYMAPEQASQTLGEVGPAADIFSLGAILYELLSGRPPFKEENTVSTIMKLTHEEAPRLHQLLPGLPRDLATICHKCLEKQPARRYASAVALADDLARFLRDEPIRARPVSTGERLWRWGRRNPMVATLAASVAVLLLASIGTFLWLSQERAKRAEQATRTLAERMERQAEAARGVHRALDEAKLLQSQAERDNDPFTWKLALAAARRADGLLADADPDLRRRVGDILQELAAKSTLAQEQQDQTNRDRKLVARLEELRLQMSVGRRDERFQWQTVETGFAEAFRTYGVDAGVLEIAEAARRIKERPPEVVLALAIGLDYWVYAGWASAWEDAVGTDGTRVPNFLTMAAKLPYWRKLLTLAKTVDPDPLRGQLRDAIASFNIREFSRLARAPEFLAAPPATQAMAAQILTKIDTPDVVFALLHEAHRRRPDDFWLNFRLANYHTFLKNAPNRADGLRFATAALALRPDDPTTITTHAWSLFYAGRPAEAAQGLRLFLARRPDKINVWYDLGYMLAEADQPAEAEKCYRHLLTLQPGAVLAHNNLGNLLEVQNRLEEAQEAYRAAIRVSPNYYLPHRNLARLLAHQGKVEDALASYRQALRLRPKDTFSQKEIKRLEALQKKRGRM